MNRRFLAGATLTLALSLATFGVLHSQEAPVAPEPPDPPQALLGESPARLGVRLRDVNAEKARELKLPGEYGAIVEQVEPHSPAAKAGLEKGDVILEFAGERVRSTTQLRRLVRETPAERTVNMRVSRAGQIRDLEVKLETGQDQFALSLRAPMIVPEVPMPHIEMPDLQLGILAGGPVLGVSADELTSQLAAYFGVKEGKGVLVREVEAGSAAEKAGVKAGDVIVAVDGKPVASVSDLRQALPRDFEGKKAITLGIVRDRQEIKLPVELESQKAIYLHGVEEEVNAISPAELQKLVAAAAKQSEIQKAAVEAADALAQQRQVLKDEVESARRQAEIQKAAAAAALADSLAAEKQRSMDEVRRSLELLKEQLKDLQLQRMQEQAHPGDVV